MQIIQLIYRTKQFGLFSVCGCKILQCKRQESGIEEYEELRGPTVIYAGLNHQGKGMTGAADSPRKEEFHETDIYRCGS